MAAIEYTPTSVSSDLVKLHRKITGKLFEGFNFKNPEYDAMPTLSNFEIDWSAREILVPIDLNEAYGAASIPEGGWEAEPSTPTLEEISLTWVQFNKRFTLTKMAQYIDQAQGLRPQVKRVLTHSGAKAIQAISRLYSTYSYGFSTAILAKVSSAAGAPTYTLKDAFGVSGLASGAPEYFAELIKAGDKVAIVNPTGPALRGVATVDSVDASAGSITLDSSVGSAAANDYVILANSVMSSPTLTAGTDYNKGLVGILDAVTSSSLHGLTHDNWVAAMADTSGGRLSGVRVRKAKDTIANKYGKRPDTLTIDQGVYRDFTAQYQAAVRFNDPLAIETDSDVKNKNLTIFQSRLVPPGFAELRVKEAYSKATLMDKPGAPAYADGDKMQDRNAMVFSLDFPIMHVDRARSAHAYWTGLTRQ